MNKYKLTGGLMSNFVKEFELNKLKSKTKEKLYSKLLSAKWNIPYKVEIDLIPIQKDIPKLNQIGLLFEGNNLCVYSFYYNFYLKTGKAIKRERYKTFGNAISALKKLCDKYGYTVNQLRIYKNDKHIYTINV